MLIRSASYSHAQRRPLATKPPSLPSVEQPLDPASPQPKVAISAYIDGKAHAIESLKLNAIARFVQAQTASQGDLVVTVDGQRHGPGSGSLKFAAAGLLPTALAGAAGFALGGLPGAVAGAGLGLACFALPAGFFLGRSLKALAWKSENRLTINGPSLPSPVPKPGVERLRSLVEESEQKYPQARQILFLSGHGDRHEIAQMSVKDIGQGMQGTKLDATVLDACLVGQLEVMAQLAPWAGLVLASPHKIKARGLELVEMLKPENLDKQNTQDFAVAMAREARSTTPSFAVVDTHHLKDALLPSLDDLGHSLAEGLKHPDSARLIKRSLARSQATDALLSSRIDLGSFLKQLARHEVSPEQTAPAILAFEKAVPFQKNRHTLSFDLKAGRSESSLPKGWRTFLETLNRSFKPWANPFAIIPHSSRAEAESILLDR